MHRFLYRLKDEINLNIINEQKRTHYDEFDIIRKNIYQSPQKEWTINSLAKLISISPSYFKHLYKELFQVSCIDDVINARIMLAKILLIENNYSIKEIYEKCGYNNEEHFIRQFKKRTGQSPNKYRQLYWK